MAFARTVTVNLNDLRQRDGEARWQFLVRVLETCGPMTTGQLGHIYGIGQNVRGIRREANQNLRRYGKQIISEPTLDIQGRRLPWATYRLVDTELESHLRRTEAELAERRAALAGRHHEAARGFQRPASRRKERPCASGAARRADSPQRSLL